MSNFFTNEFQPSSSAAWKQKIQFELDGADYNQTLLTKTNEGITIKPFYHSDSFEKIQVPIIDNTFKICQSVTILNEETANNEALTAIEKGVSAIIFNATKPFNFKIVFQNLFNKNTEFHFNFSFLSEKFIQEICEILITETIYLNIDTSDEHYLTNLSWTPDEKYVLVAEVNRGQNHLWYNLYNAKNGNKVKTLFEETNEKWVEPEFDAVFLPKSDDDFLWLSERDGFMNIYHYTTDGKLVKQLTKFNWVVTGILGFDENGKKLQAHLYRF